MANTLKTQSFAVYTSESQLVDPIRLLRGMARDLLLSRELAWRLFLRNISSRYRQTILGYAWAVVTPTATTSVFVFLQKAGYFRVGETQVPYAVFLLTGLILWQAFADAVHAPLRMVQQSYSILTKVNFPREALILAGVSEVLFTFLIRLGLILSALFWFDVRISWTAVWFPFGALLLIGLGIALGLLITPVAALYHDVGQALPFMLYLWMFLTPVIYPAATAGTGSRLLWLNPVSPVLEATRAWLLSGGPDDPLAFLIVSGLSVFALLVGWLLYRLALPILIERVSA